MDLLVPIFAGGSRAELRIYGPLDGGGCFLDAIEGVEWIEGDFEDIEVDDRRCRTM